MSVFIYINNKQQNKQNKTNSNQKYIMKGMIRQMSTTSENVQYFTNKFYEKANATFLSKEDGINGIILGQDWELVDNVVANNTITLPSIDTINEIHIETQSDDATIVHQVTITKDSLLFESTNTTHREILVDSIFDVQTFVTYNIADNTITLTSYEGVDVDDTSTTITTKVYIKKMSIADGTFSAERLSYDNSASGLSANNVQDAIDELKSENGFTLTSTLTTGQTSLTFTDARITENSILSAVYTSIFGVGVKSAEITNGSLVLTFKAQIEDMAVKVVIK